MCCAHFVQVEAWCACVLEDSRVAPRATLARVQKRAVGVGMRVLHVARRA